MEQDDLDARLGFAPDYDAPIPYMQRTRDYYAAIGYTTPYRWAHHIDAPFTPLRTPLARARVAIVTTAAPYQPGKGDQGPGAAYNGSAKFYARLFRRHVARPRPAHLPYRLRPRPHQRRGQRHLVPPPCPAPRRRCRPHRRRRRRASTARRPTAATASPSKPTRRTSCAACAMTAPTPPSWCPTARSATRPAAWSRATWRPTASPPC